MRADRTALCAWLACCATAAALSAHKYSTRVVRTKYGPLRGIIAHAHPPVEAYLGVPYATPPLGSLRYMPPVTPSMWRAPRLADAPGPACPQAPPPAARAPRADALLQYPRARLRQLDRLLPLLANQSEDCLYVNLYVPVGGKYSYRMAVGLLVMLFSPYKTLEIFPERPQVTYANPKYVKYVNVTTQRERRGGLVLSSLHAHIRHAWGNNVTAELVMYEFLSNEYKRSFIQVRWRVCDSINKIPFVGTVLSQTDLANRTCPYAAGEYHLVNITMNRVPLPEHFPFRKGRVNIDLTLTEPPHTRVIAALCYFEMRGF